MKTMIEWMCRKCGHRYESRSAVLCPRCWKFQ